MKKMFRAYVPPDDEDFKDLWNTAVFVLDTNVVLNLYRFTDSTRNEFLAIMDSVRDRLWMPHQVGWEFFRRRASAMTDNERDVARALRQAKKALDESVKGLRGRQASTRVVDEVLDVINAKLDHVDEVRDEKLELYNQSDEPVLEKLLELYDGRVGGEPTAEWLNKHFELGRSRYSHQIPPGYEDLKDKRGADDRSLYGDYLLWREVLEEAKRQGWSVILVTNDAKPDWVEEKFGKKLGPRKEMLEEFGRETGSQCWVYTVPAFLAHAAKQLRADVSEGAMREANQLARPSPFPLPWGPFEGSTEYAEAMEMIAAMAEDLPTLQVVQNRAIGEILHRAEALKAETALPDNLEELAHIIRSQYVVNARHRPPQTDEDS